MPINNTGPISFGGDTQGRSINLGLRKSATASISMNDADVRGLAGIATGAISFSDFYNKEQSYSITPSATSVNEGASVTFTVTTTGVLTGTVLYWSTTAISGTVNASDFTDNAVTGTITVNNGTAIITRTLANDTTTEGSESFQLQLRTGSVNGTVVAGSVTVTINDTSLSPPTYAVTPGVTSVNEGGSVTFTVTTANVVNGTTLYWSTQQISGTVNNNDFTDLTTVGSFTINNNSGSIVRGIREDANTEGTESFALQIRTGSTSGTLVATSATVTINDTSLTVLAAPGQIEFVSSALSDRFGPNSGLTQGSSTIFNWTVPAGVFSISVVMIGGGGAGRNFSSGQGRRGGGGGGGALVYRNNIPVTPGGTVQMEVGNGGQNIQTSSTDLRTSGNGGSTIAFVAGPSGGFTNIGGRARGGDGGADGFNQTGGLGGLAENISGTDRGGANGGRGGQYVGLGGGGGAAGYTGNGGSGGGNNNSATGGSGGSGGGGGFKNSSSGGAISGAAGGTGLQGQGPNGTAGANSTLNAIADLAGNGGAGSNGVGKLYGAGGAAGLSLFGAERLPTDGGPGAVRIMWPGDLRQYPSTRTADE